METRVWLLRPIVWFAAASIVTTILHELTHACTAYLLGVSSTLFNYSSDLDLTPAQAATNLPAIIAVSGPMLCLIVGIVCRPALTRARGSAAELPLLYLTVFGIGTFMGNLMSASFVGDFSRVSEALSLPMIARYTISVAGALGLAGIHFWAGKELIEWVPQGVGRLAGVLGIVVLPLVLGTAGVILINMPMHGSSVNARVIEASFWLFAAAGALTRRKPSSTVRGTLSLGWADGVVILLVVMTVRLMVGGITLRP